MEIYTEMKTYRTKDYVQFYEQKNCNSGNVLLETQILTSHFSCCRCCLRKQIHKEKTCIYWALTRITTKNINNVYDTLFYK